MTVPALTFVPKQTSAPTDNTVPLEEIPQELRNQVEEVYTTLKQYDGNMHAEFPSKQEMLRWERLVKSYVAQRPAGPIHYRRSPVRNQAEGHVNFRITDVPTKNAEVAEGIKEAVKKVGRPRKTAAPDAPAAE